MTSFQNLVLKHPEKVAMEAMKNAIAYFNKDDDFQQPLGEDGSDTSLSLDSQGFSSFSQEVRERSTNEITGLSSGELLEFERQGQGVHTDSIAAKKRGQVDRPDVDMRKSDLTLKEREIRDNLVKVTKR